MAERRSAYLIAKFAALAVMASLFCVPPHTAAGALRGACSLIDFNTVHFEDGGRRGWYLYIGGARPFANMDVVLEHRAGRRGDWIIEVVGCSKNALLLPVPTPFSLELPMRDLPAARRLVIIGSNGSVRRNVPGR